MTAFLHTQHPLPSAQTPTLSGHLTPLVQEFFVAEKTLFFVDNYTISV